MIKNNSAKKWQSRCFQRTRDGFYYTKPRYRKRRETICCGTNILAQAGVVAKTIYMALRSKGWDAVLAEYSPASHKTPRASPEGSPAVTVGDYCSKAKATYIGQPRTIDDYLRAFRRVAADIYMIERGSEKYDYVSEGRYAWIAKVDKIRLADVTRVQIEAWRVAFLAEAGRDLDKLRAKTSANTMLRMCKALFSTERLELIGLDVVSPFARIKLDPVGDMRFKGGVDAQALTSAAITELDVECLKAFVLSLWCGLRRNETDKLEWSAFHFDTSQLHVGPTTYLHVKSQKSIGDVDLDENTIAFFRGHFAKRKSNFVLESSIDPRVQAGYSHYRCANTFEKLAAWLRAHGIKGGTPIHTLRKMFGSLLCDQFGIHTASQALRHADIGITSRHYVTKRARATVNLTGLLPPAAEKIVDFPNEAAG